MNSAFCLKNTFFSNIILLIILLRCAIVLMPVLTTLTSQIINISSLLFLFCVLFVNGQRLTSREWINCIIVCAVSILETISTLFSNSGTFVVTLYGFIQTIIWPLFGFYVVSNFSIKQQSVIAGSVILMIAITMITTYIGCLQYPSITRNLATPSSVETGLQEIASIQNIGGFSFVYTVSLMSPLVIFSLKKSNMFRKIICIVLLLLLFKFILATGYTTAFFVVIASLFLLRMPDDNQRWFFFKLIVFAFFIVILFKFLLSDILLNFSQVVGNDEISIRLNEVAKLLSGEDLGTADDTVSRIELWEKSLTGFFQNIIFGTKSIGGHSYIFDNMALYGILGLISLILSFKGTRFCLIKSNSNAYSAIYGYRIFIYEINLFLCLFNTVNFIFITTFFYPVLFNVYQSRVNEMETIVMDLTEGEEYY